MVTLAEFEALLAELDKACERNSGLPAFDSLENRRKEVLTAISELRPLIRWEFICLHGYIEWVAFTAANDLPEDAPFAEIVAGKAAA